jgi:hypothetical protein
MESITPIQEMKNSEGMMNYLLEISHDLIKKLMRILIRDSKISPYAP